MSLELSDAHRRRSPASEQAPEAAETAPSQNGPALGSSPRIGAIGNQAVQGALAGNGLGAFSPVVAAEMMMANAGIDPTLLGSDSNSSMQRAMKTGGEEGQPGIDQAIASMVGGGPLPESAMNRVQTATGGTLGPMSGIPGTQPGVPRHFVDTSRAGINQSTDPRDHAGRDTGDVEQVFGAMASMTDNELNLALHQAGREMMAGVGEEGVREVVGGIAGGQPAAEGPQATPTEGPGALDLIGKGIKQIKGTGQGLGDSSRQSLSRGADIGSTLVNLAQAPGRVQTLLDGDLNVADAKAATGLATTGIDAARLLSGAGEKSSLGRASKVAGAVGGLVNAPGQVSELADGDWDQRDAEAVVGLGKTALDTTDAAGRVADYVSTKRAATAAFREAAPGASRSMLNAATSAAANSAIGGVDRPAGKLAIEAAMSKIQGNSTLAAEMGTTGRSAARTAQRTASGAATTAARTTAGTSKLAKAGAMAGSIAKGSGSLVGKAGARFVPGLNAAVAALDAKNAYDTLNDPEASTTSKVTSVLTAAGSIAAATNIPIVSQVGGAVSMVSSLIGSFWG